MSDCLTRLWNRKAVRYAILIILSAMAALSLVQGIRNAAAFSQDFQWDAARALVLGADPYEESMHPGTYPAVSAFKEYCLQMEANQFPSLLMLLIPYTFLPPLIARYAWIVSNLIFTVGIVILLRATFLKRADRDLFAAFMLLMIAGTPYRNQLGVGQHTLFSFFFFLLGVWFLEREDRKVSFAGAVLALFICYFKYTLTVPLAIYFIYKKRYPEIVISALMHVILTGVAAWWLNDSFINMIIKPLKVSGALAAEGGLDFGALLNGSPAAYVLALIVMAGLFAMAVLPVKGGGREEKDADGRFISVLILWSLILTYHRTYDFFVIVTVLAFFLDKDGTVTGSGGKDEDKKGRIKRYLWPGYLLVLIAVFFVLRVFSESVPSKIAVGTIYYLFTAAVTAAAIILRESKDG
ncbi:MAG: DUF2029 domain-containing protein [Lachnospiraceae bacterium]|nr:DUF2029 domain-containing protein [Lachnospiraceae bacterium]